MTTSSLSTHPFVKKLWDHTTIISSRVHVRRIQLSRRQKLVIGFLFVIGLLFVGKRIFGETNTPVVQASTYIVTTGDIKNTIKVLWSTKAIHQQTYPNL